MERHFEKELSDLKATVVKMGIAVEESFIDSLTALFTKNAHLAKKVIASDSKINSFEILIDNGVVDVLALQQPVATDLRLILAIQKINNDLERIGDHAVNIAESALGLINAPDDEALLEIPQMADIAKEMFREAMGSFVQLDPKLAQFVLESDDRIDTLNRAMITEVVRHIQKDLKGTEGYLHILRISRNLERIADLTTNIAEEVIFHTQARVVKHHAEEEKQK